MIRRSLEPGLGGVISLESQPFLQGHEAAPKSQWDTVEALWYRPSGWLVGLRLLWGRFEGKGAVDGMSPFPVADSPETTPPGLGLKRSLIAAIGMHWALWCTLDSTDKGRLCRMYGSLRATFPDRLDE